jgi:hypothetical protein
LGSFEGNLNMLELLGGLILCVGLALLGWRLLTLGGLPPIALPPPLPRRPFWRAVSDTLEGIAQTIGALLLIGACLLVLIYFPAIAFYATAPVWVIALYRMHAF